MVMPNSTLGQHAFEVIVEYHSDIAAQQRVLAGASTIEKELKKIEEQARKAGTAIGSAIPKELLNPELIEQFKHMRGAVNFAKEEVKELSEEEKKLAKNAAQAASSQAAVFSAQAAGLNARQRQLQIMSREYRRLADAVGIVSRAMLVTGGAITGGIFKLATDYVKNAPQATEVTLRWKAAQDSLNQSQQRFGAVFAEQALPLLRKAAQLAREAADFVEKNPEVVRAALNTGLVLTTLGTIGVLVSKGIQLKSDILYIQSVPIQLRAAELQAAAAEQQLVAAQLRAESKGVEVLDDVAGGGAALGKAGPWAGFLSFLGQAAVLLGSFVAGLVVADKIFDKLEGEDKKLSDYTATLKQMTALTVKKWGDFFGKDADWSLRPGQQAGPKDLGDQWFVKVRDALFDLKENADSAADSLDNLPQFGTVEASPARDKILAAYEKYKEEDLDLVRDHYAKRQDIVKDGLTQEREANQKYIDNVADVNRKLGTDLAKATADFEKQNVEAEKNYAKQRADIIKDGGQDLLQIEADLQEQLRKQELEHQDRNAELLRQRDAVGLVLEAQRHAKEQAEAVRDANREIGKRRQDTAARLQELAAEYAEEKRQRLAEYQERLTELRAQATERLNELRLQHEAEIRKIREQTAAKIREADAQFVAERKRRYDYFVQTIKDLDAYLLGQRKIILATQAQELADLNAWAAKYRQGLINALPGATPLPGKAEGGYASGAVVTGERGYEWIASHATTVAAERLLGSRLTQDNFLSVLRAGAGRGSTTATYNDYKRMEFPMGKEQKAVYYQVAVQAIEDVLGRRA